MGVHKLKIQAMLLSSDKHHALKAFGRFILILTMMRS
jgi:hypothetical protein